MQEALRRRIVGLVVSVVGLGVIVLLSCAILVVLWIALMWVGHFAAMVLPVWLVTTVRYAVWGYALVSVSSMGVIVIFTFGHDALQWAYTAVGLHTSEKSPAP
jgi:uncharacterized BrkB/YihY/UPF0761 family membrane protein